MSCSMRIPELLASTTGGDSANANKKPWFPTAQASRCGRPVPIHETMQPTEVTDHIHAWPDE